jgi:hypothetical protein
VKIVGSYSAAIGTLGFASAQTRSAAECLPGTAPFRRGICDAHDDKRRRFHAEAEELLRTKDNASSEMKKGPRQRTALEKIDHHESLWWKSEVSGR